MSKPQKTYVPLAFVVGVAVFGAGAGFFLLSSEPSGPVVAQVRAPAVAATPADPASGRDSPNRVGSAVASTANSQPVGSANDKPSKPNRLARDLEREQIWSALGRKHKLEPAGPGSAAPSETEAEQLPALDPEYIRDAIREQLVPVAMDCYNTVLEQDNQAAGSLVFDFTIIGDEEIGGVVEAVSIGEDSTFDSEFLRECLSESLLAVTFPPPPDGGRVEVSYPILFEPE